MTGFFYHPLATSGRVGTWQLDDQRRRLYQFPKIVTTIPTVIGAMIEVKISLSMVAPPFGASCHVFILSYIFVFTFCKDKNIISI